MGLVGIGGTDRNGKLLNSILAQVGDEDEAVQRVAAIRLNLSDGGPNTEGVWGGGGGLLPLDGAVALLSPDAVVVILGLKELTPSKVVALDRPGLASEVLDTVSWGPGK